MHASPTPRTGTAPRRKTALIAVAAAVVVALAVGTVLYVRYQNNQRELAAQADDAAVEFSEALAEHEEVWTTEAVEATYGVDLASLYPDVDPFSQEGVELLGTFGDTCDSQAQEIEAFDELEGSARPELAQVEGTSDAYAEAEQRALRSQALAEAEEIFLSEGRDLSQRLQDHCVVWREQGQLVADADAVNAEVRRAQLTPPGELDRGEGFSARCPEGSDTGCLPFSAEGRDELADAYTALYQALDEAFEVLYSEDLCFEGYEDYCEARRDLGSYSAEKVATMTDLYRGPVTQDDDGNFYPGYLEAIGEWQEGYSEREERAEQILAELDVAANAEGPNSDLGQHQLVVYTSWQDRIEELARAALGERETADA